MEYLAARTEYSQILLVIICDHYESNIRVTICMPCTLTKHARYGTVLEGEFKFHFVYYNVSIGIKKNLVNIVNATPIQLPN